MTMYVFNLCGVFVFALSGAMAADRRRMDLFGFIVIALLPALGGGTLRDIIIDAPVFWLADPAYVSVSVAAAVLTYSAANLIQRAERWLIWADALGLALFCVLGTAKALSLGHNEMVAVMMGVMTGVVGGIIRDVVCNEVPLVLQRDIYATAAFAGSVGFLVLSRLEVDPPLAIGLGAALCFVVRGAAIIWNLSLPRRGGEPGA